MLDVVLVHGTEADTAALREEVADVLEPMAMRLSQAERHHWSWGEARRRFATPTGRWLPIAADGIELFRIASVTVSRHRNRAGTIPGPWHPANPP